MDIVFRKTFWEMDLQGVADPMRAFISRVAADGFEGTEMFLPLLPEDPREALSLHDEFGLLRPVIDIVTDGDTPEEHRQSFDDAVARALTFDPVLINSHTGRDIFPFSANVELFRHACARSAEIGVPIIHETHRYRPTYSAIETRRYLEELPDLLLNADLSHWMVVHESDLSDQHETVDIALRRSRHIHARVGYEEGPQVTDPRTGEWANHVDNHVALWQRIVDYNRSAGQDVLSITPEFGPPPYAHTVPGTAEPLVDVWEVNVHMRDLLRQRLV